MADVAEADLSEQDRSFYSRREQFNSRDKQDSLDNANTKT